MRKILISTVFSAALATAPVLAETMSKEIGDAPKGAQNYQVEAVAAGLNNAWSLAFLPNGDMLVTEKVGRLRVIRNGELLDTAVAGVPEIHLKGQAGLFEVVVHPDFENNNLVYLSYAHPDGRRNTLRLARARFVPSAKGGSLEDFEVLFTGESWRKSSAHYGGKIIFLPDGTLMMTTGEGYAHREESQKLDNHFGKIVRLNDDGSIPADNPFVDRAGALPEIWSYGHRNPQGLIFDAETGNVFAHEHGPRGGDEVNLIQKGKNYGWPVITYGVDYSGAIISPYQQLDGMEQSIVHYVPSIAPSGFALYAGDKFPAWKGDIFIGALAHKHVRRIDIENGQFQGQERLFDELGHRIRDVRTGPDGYLYIVTDKKGGQVLRVKPN